MYIVIIPMTSFNCTVCKKSFWLKTSLYIARPSRRQILDLAFLDYRVVLSPIRSFASKSSSNPLLAIILENMIKRAFSLTSKNNVLMVVGDYRGVYSYAVHLSVANHFLRPPWLKS